jgi:ubiquitin-protein ligase
MKRGKTTNIAVLRTLAAKEA